MFGIRKLCTAYETKGLLDTLSPPLVHRNEWAHFIFNCYLSIVFLYDLDCLYSKSKLIRALK